MAVSVRCYGALTASSTPRNFASRRRRRAATMAAASEEVGIRVCVNRSCGRQGSREILETLSSLAPAGVGVASCGCLGRCGAGPNLAVLPRGVIVSHCGTASQAAKLLTEIIGSGYDAKRNLEALAMRKNGEKEMELRNYSEAEALFSQVIELEPSGGLHLTYRSRSVARLNKGNYDGALEDAETAARIAPKYPQAYLSKGDAFLAMEKWDSAGRAYSTALLIDPSIRRSKSFKARIAKLQEKLVAAGAS